MNIAAVIPSRYHSTRFPGKPLAKIKGTSMVERVYSQVQKSCRFSEIIVATDDERIVTEVERFGGEACLTSIEHKSGTDRLWEVVESRDYEAVINIQGDEPLISESLVADFYDELEKGKHPVLSAAHFSKSYQNFLSDTDVKVVLNGQNRAVYFSRAPIPWQQEGEFSGFYHHIGIYGFQKSALNAFINSVPSPLELQERLEQLRFYELGIPIHILITEYQSQGVDVPDDIAKVEDILTQRDPV